MITRNGRKMATTEARTATASSAMLTNGLKTPAVPTVTAGRVVTLTALTDPASTARAGP